MPHGVIVILALLLSSCSLLQSTTVPQLLSPAALGAQLQLNQTLVSEVDGKRQQILIALKVTQQQMLMLGLSVEGQRLFTLNYDGLSLQQKSLSSIAKKLDGEHIMRLVQLAYWPAEALRLSYGKNYQLIELENQRRLMHYGDKIITIDYNDEPPWRGSITIVHHQQELKLKITTTDFTAL